MIEVTLGLLYLMWAVDFPWDMMDIQMGLQSFYYLYHLYIGVVYHPHLLLFVSALEWPKLSQLYSNPSLRTRISDQALHLRSIPSFFIYRCDF